MASSRPDRHHPSLSPGSEDVPRPAMVSMHIVVSAMAGALVIMGIVLVILGGELLTPDVWALGLVTLATVAAWGGVLMSPVRRGPEGASGPHPSAMVGSALPLDVG